MTGHTKKCHFRTLPKNKELISENNLLVQNVSKKNEGIKCDMDHNLQGK